MSDTAKVFGTTYTGVTALKVSDGNSGTLTYIRPTGTKSITANGTGIDVTEYAAVDVSVSGGGSGGDEFLIILTLNQNNDWVPNKTFSEIETAYNNGKTIVTIASYTEDEDTYTYQSSCVFDDTGLNPYFGYSVIEPHCGQYSDDVLIRDYAIYSDSSNNDYHETIFYNPFDADATSNDVLNGKIFFNNNGSAVGSIPQRSSTDLTASGDTVTAPAGYYAAVATKSVASGSAATPATTISVTPGISVSSAGLITATASGTQSVTPTVSAGYVSAGTAGTITVSGSNTSQLSTQAAVTIHPSSTDQTIASGKYLTGAQTIKAVTVANLAPSTIRYGETISVGDSTDADCVTSVTGLFSSGDYLSDCTPALASQIASGCGAYLDGEQIIGTAPWQGSTTMTVSGATVTAPAGYYEVASSKSVASGTAGTPTATKGTVSNHQVSVTPSVTNTTGYITGSTKTGTAVTVSASELASGNKAITDNGMNIDVVGYSTVSVAVPFSTIYVETTDPTSSDGSNGDIWIKTEGS